MGQSGGDTDFPQKPGRPQRLGQIGTQDLNGHLTVVFEVASEIDGRHSSTTDLTIDRVVFCQNGS
jgi:hypothetical protein